MGMARRRTAVAQAEQLVVEVVLLQVEVVADEEHEARIASDASA